jgi:hypothetical protein
MEHLPPPRKNIVSAKRRKEKSLCFCVFLGGFFCVFFTLTQERGESGRTAVYSCKKGGMGDAAAGDLADTTAAPLLSSTSDVGDWGRAPRQTAAAAVSSSSSSSFAGDKGTGMANSGNAGNADALFGRCSVSGEDKPEDSLLGGCWSADMF